MTVQDIYACIDAFAPFFTQEKWDNSGLLTGLPGDEVTGVLVTLDISCAAVEQALQHGCNVLVSHHPVIFSPLRSLSYDSIPYRLAAHRLHAICDHTPLDIAPGGINDLLVARFRQVLPIGEEVLPLDADGCGRIVTLTQAATVGEIAHAARQALGCTCVRFSAAQVQPVRRLGICSGSGASMLEEIAGRCDCLLTGDVKHDRWYKAEELGIGLLDCGHYHTEIVMVPYVAEKLREAFPALHVVAFEEGDPVSYV